MAENVAVFEGWPGAITGIAGRLAAQAHAAGEPAGYPRAVARAVELLLDSGIAGPYGLALGPDPYRVVSETAEGGGYPLWEHLRGSSTARSYGPPGSPEGSS